MNYAAAEVILAAVFAVICAVGYALYWAADTATRIINHLRSTR